MRAMRKTEGGAGVGVAGRGKRSKGRVMEQSRTIQLLGLFKDPG